MALKKSVESSMGVSFEYWRVMPDIIVQFADGTARAHIMLWANQAARQADKMPGHTHDFMDLATAAAVQEALVLSGQDFTAALETGDLRAAFYVRLKALSFFTGAEDV